MAVNFQMECFSETWVIALVSGRTGNKSEACFSRASLLCLHKGRVVSHGHKLLKYQGCGLERRVAQGYWLKRCEAFCLVFIAVLRKEGCTSGKVEVHSTHLKCLS